MTIDYLRKNFRYLSEKKDTWRVMQPDEKGLLWGDCDDYAVTALWIMCGKSWFKFWAWQFVFKARLRFCKVGGDGHLVLQMGNRAIDNNYRVFVPMQTMKDRGYRFKFKPGWWLFTVIPKMIKGKLRE